MVCDLCCAFSPVTAKAASFGSVPPRRDSKRSEAYFLKEAKAAALQLRSPAGCGGEDNKAKRADDCIRLFVQSGYTIVNEIKVIILVIVLLITIPLSALLLMYLLRAGASHHI